LNESFGPADLEVRRDLARHLPALFAHAQRLTRNRTEAEDLVQAGVLRALAFATTFEPGTNLKGWLHQVLESVFLSDCRRRARERRALGGLESDPCAWFRSDALPAMRGLSPPVATALLRLPSSYRDVVRLVDVEELSYRDAANELGVPLGTIMSRLHRGRRLLAETLGERSQTETEASATPRAAAA
jgi:RNA polymerase sigma-70 factor (ECF subfamily)